MRKNSFFIHLALLVLMVVFTTSCLNNPTQQKAKVREQLQKEIESFQKQLPLPVEGTGISITGMDLNDDIISYTYSVSEENWKEIAGPEEIANSDKNLARIFNNIPRAAADLFVKHGLGLKMIYKSKESGETLRVLEIPADKLKEIKEKTDKGELDAYSLLELTKMEIAEMKFPAKLEDGVWMTNAYVKGNSICYEAKLDEKLNPSDLSSSDKANMKKELIKGLKEEGNLMIHKQEILKEDIHFVYIYNDKRGVELTRIDISPSDLK